VGLGGLAQALGGPPPRTYEPLVRRYVVLLSAESKGCFDQSRDPDGNPWAALRRPRERKRDKRARGGGGGQKPLRDSDVLMLSVTARGEGHVEELGPTSLRWGTNLPYAGTHQEGKTIRVPEWRAEQGGKPRVFKAADGKAVFTRHIRAYEVEIPARPFLGVTDRLAGRMADMAADYARRLFLRRGAG
jgi:phage gpG-like protein